MKRFTTIELALLLLLLAADAPSSEQLLSEAKEKYDAGQFVEAQDLYEQAIDANPGSKTAQFNLGVVLYQLGDFERALTQFQSALGDVDDQFASKVYYNIGNAQYRLKRVRLSLEAYKKAVELSPEDLDARTNLELVARQIAASELSERARKTYAQAMALVENRAYREALDLMQPVVREEPPAAQRFAAFLARLEQVVDLVEADSGDGT